MSGYARANPDAPEYPVQGLIERADLDNHDEEHDVWGNRGKPSDIYGQRDER